MAEGVIISAAAAARLTKALRLLEAGGLDLSPFRAAPQPPRDQQFLAVIAAAGPNAEADYADERYWFRSARCTNSSGGRADRLTVAAYPEDHRLFVHATAGNLAELLGGGHGLAIGTIVRVLALFDPRESAGKHYYFSSAPTAAFPVLVTKDGGASGGAAAECTWTYTVKDLNEVTLKKTQGGSVDATLITPEVPRLHYVAYWYAGETRTLPNVATSRYGLAFYADTLKLLVCFGEIPQEGPCA